jgi:hypothetical protein
MTAEQQQQLQQQAPQTFQRELPQLWTEHPGQWVAYAGVRLLAFAREKHELYQECLQCGLRREEFVVFCIEHQETEVVLGPVVVE